MEAAGAAATIFGITDFALTVGETIWKIRKLWVEVQEAPDTIGHLQSEINMLEQILPGVDPRPDAEPTGAVVPRTHHSHPPTRAAVSRCREALDDLQNLVKDLSREIDSAKRGRRGLARLRVVLKKGDVDQFQCRLDRAIHLLQVALTSFHVTQTSFQSAKLDMVCTQMVQLTALAEKQAAAMEQMRRQAALAPRNDKQQAAEGPPNEVGHGHPKKSTYASLKQGCNPELPRLEQSSFGRAVVRSSRSKTSSVYRARLQLPCWLSQKAWDLSVTISTFGWQTSLVTFNTVPQNSPVFQYARQDNLQQLRELFRQGLASPVDRDSDGLTVLFYAGLGCSINVMQELMGYEQLRNMVNAQEWSYCLSLITRNQSHFRPQGLPETLQPLLARGLLTLASGGVSGLDYICEACFDVLISSADVTWSQKFLEGLSWHEDWPPKYKDIAIRGTWCSIYRANTLRRMVCPPGLSIEDTMQEWAADEISLIDLIFFCAGRSYQNPRWSYKDDDVWEDLMGTVITADIGCFAYPNWWEDRGTEILLEFLGGQDHDLAYMKPREITTRVETRMRQLLRFFKDFGADLTAFGRSFTNTGGPEKLNPMILGLRRGPNFHFTGMQYGPTPEEWGLDWDFVLDGAELAADFWNWAEPRPQAVPGAWPDEDW